MTDFYEPTKTTGFTEPRTVEGEIFPPAPPAGHNLPPVIQTVDDQLKALSRKINVCFDKVDELVGKTVYTYIDAGRGLIEARKLVPDGEWHRWLKANIMVSIRSAQKWMERARLYDEAEDDDDLFCDWVGEITGVFDDPSGGEAASPPKGSTKVPTPTKRGAPKTKVEVKPPESVKGLPAGKPAPKRKTEIIEAARQIAKGAPDEETAGEFMALTEGAVRVHEYAEFVMKMCGEDKVELYRLLLVVAGRFYGIGVPIEDVVKFVAGVYSDDEGDAE